MTREVTVLGPGPAGCVSALALARMGFRVTLLGILPTRFRIEGVSSRVVEGFRQVGCGKTLDLFAQPVARTASWNGETRRVNEEYLVDRKDLDAALVQDAEAAGVEIIKARIRRLRRLGAGWRIDYRGPDGGQRSHTAAFVVEARGRRAPRPRPDPLGGPPGPRTLALSQRLAATDQPQGTWVASFPDGWAWALRRRRGDGILQIFLDGERGRFAAPGALEAAFGRALGQLPDLARWLDWSDPGKRPWARDATPARHPNPVEQDMIRVGDACLAADPLSGHGLFEATGGAMAAAAVINTLLNRPQDTDIAERFYRDRVSFGFQRLSRVGRDFYRTETRWPDRPFWSRRGAWPDDLPAHGDAAREPARVEIRPVIKDGFVIEREVVVAPDQPRGVAWIDGVPLSDLLAALGAAQPNPETLANPEALARQFSVPPQNILAALSQLQRWGLTQSS